MKFEPTDVHRKVVMGLAERQMPIEDMVLLLERHDGTVLNEADFRAAFDFEIRMGGAVGRLSIAENLTKSAGAGSAAAQIFLAKAHLGWTEKSGSKNPDDASTEKAPTFGLPSNENMKRMLRIAGKSSRRSSE